MTFMMDEDDDVDDEGLFFSGPWPDDLCSLVEPLGPPFEVDEALPCEEPKALTLLL